MESALVRSIEELEKQLKELKLEKRRILLAGKKTEEIDNKIQVIEFEIKNITQEKINNWLVIKKYILAYKKIDNNSFYIKGC